MLYYFFGWFPEVWILFGNVSGHSVSSIFIGIVSRLLAYEAWNDRLFRNVGTQFGRLGITQKKEYKIQNTAKVLNRGPPMFLQNVSLEITALSHTVKVQFKVQGIIFLTYALQPLRPIVRSGLDVPTFATRRLHACHHARAPSGGMWNCGREMSGNFAQMPIRLDYWQARKQVYVNKPRPLLASLWISHCGDRKQHVS
jgi:hypothetical protein